MEAGFDSSGNQSKLPARAQTLDGRTEGMPSNIEGFERMRTLLHQRRCHQEIFVAKTRKVEFLEVDITWSGQQSMGQMFHSSLQRKLKGPSTDARARSGTHTSLRKGRLSLPPLSPATDNQPNLSPPSASGIRPLAEWNATPIIGPRGDQGSTTAQNLLLQWSA
jgi:hypothetical protein